MFDYRDIFELRGSYYHQAMEGFPNARAQEFLSVIQEAGIGAGMKVLDVPSGGGYLSRYLPDASVIGLETSQTFARLAAARGENTLLYEKDRLPIRTGCADRVLSIAGLHHVEDKCGIFAEMRRVLRPGALMIVADVAEGSPVQQFLDTFVGGHLDMGHSGWYFGDKTRSELKDAGLDIITDKGLDFCWCAPSLDQLAEFCRLLFGIVGAETSLVADAIRSYLGVRIMQDQVGLNWQLHCFVCRQSKPSGGDR